MSLFLKPFYVFSPIRYFSGNDKILYTLRLKKGSTKDKVSIRKTLSATNSLLYGPILKRSKSKKRNKRSSQLGASNNSLKEVHFGTFRESNNLNTLPSKEDNLSIFKNASEEPKLDENEFKYTLRESKLKKVSKNIVKPLEDINFLDFNVQKLDNFSLVNSKKTTEEMLLQSSSIYNINIFEGGYKKIPSVQNILQETMPDERKKILEKWERNMIKKLGEDGFTTYKKG